ncbi:MAG: hypothetical protein JWO10_761 [Microbacteriaceae bacterium]|nr:hypothetical protein [Microbacteriaceae bacterium]
MPRPYPAEFRARAVAMVLTGNPVSRVAAELQVSEAGLHNWVRQGRIDRAEIPGLSTAESEQLRLARKRIRELEREVEVLRMSSPLLREPRPHPKESTR